ncbi:MAG: TraV family lipoprotein [Aquificaceae bacterium]
MKKFIVLGLGMFVLSSCAKLMNPYSEEFSCPQMEKGKCVDPYSAYHASKYVQNVSKTEAPQRVVSPSDYTTFKQEPTERRDAEVKREVKREVKSDALIVPPRIVRVWIEPYELDGKVFGGRYVYIIVEQARLVVE